jgi:hypothetical protein
MATVAAAVAVVAHVYQLLARETELACMAQTVLAHEAKVALPVE